jgi:hypothetical protein
MKLPNIEIRESVIMIVMCFAMISCSKHIRPYRYVPQVESLYSLTKQDSIKINTRKSIIITSDTTLKYSISLGGIWIATTINYRTIDKLIVVDSIDIYNRDSFQDYTNEIFNREFIYSKDSLVDLINGEEYFSPRYIDKHFTTIKSNKFYIIVDGKKKKISSQNSKRIFSKIDTDKYELTEMSKSEAKKRFGIKPKYITYKLIEK